MALLMRNKKVFLILSQIRRVIYIMKDGSDGTMSMILRRIIHEPHDSLNVKKKVGPISHYGPTEFWLRMMDGSM